MPASWQTGSKTIAWIASAGHGCIHRPRGTIERWHQTLKNRIPLENYYLPVVLEHAIRDYVAHYNHLRYHESIANLTPAEVYFGQRHTILRERERIKRNTVKARRLHHRGHAA